MTKMRINLMPRIPRPETLTSLRDAQIGLYKIQIYNLERLNEARKKENESQARLIESYERYFNFMERRYPVEDKPGRETDDINGTGSSKRKAS